MPKSKPVAQKIAELEKQQTKDYDPEEDAPEQNSDEDSEDEESDDGLAGTEHYAAVGKSKLRKVDEVPLGPEYDGSKVSRKALLDGNEDQDVLGSETAEEKELESGSDEDDTKFADPDDLEFDVDDEDGDIDSENALGPSDDEKFQKFAFRGSSRPKDAPNGQKKRPTAADFMSDSEDEEEGARLRAEDDAGADETDEDLLDVDAQHMDDDEEDSDKEEEDLGDGLEQLDIESGSGEDESEDEGPMEEDAESEDKSESGSEDSDEEMDQRAELRKIMNEEQKNVVATISQAAKADADKGNAVKQQRKAFDSLLSVRMVLQKALVATNSMATVDEKDAEDSAPYEAAEEAAIKLWNTLDSMRHSLAKKASSAKVGQKRKRGIDSSTPSSKIWERMQSTEIAMIDNRQTTMEKWSSKVRGSTSLPLSRKLNPTAPQQSITSLIQDHLSNSEHLIKKTQIPRSCAPIQRDQKMTEDPNIYDDGNFYQLLLKELVDQRRVESLTAPSGAGDMGKTWVAVKEAKTKKNVDTKASKGRKMRFTVHEKLQNFMAPEDRTQWEPERIDRFFGTLLGQKMTLGEDEVESEEEDGVVDAEEQGLMLFRS